MRRAFVPIAAVLALWLALGATRPPPVIAQTNQCVVVLSEADGRNPVRVEPGTLVEVDRDLDYVIRLNRAAAAGNATEVRIVPFSVGSFDGPALKTISFRAGGTTSAPFSPSSFFAVGRYKVTLSGAGDCDRSAFVKITGAVWWRTPLGAAALGVLVLGIVLQVAGFVAAARGGRARGLGFALACGVVTGLGAAFVWQQSGHGPLTLGTLGTLGTPPVAIGAVVQSWLRGGKRTASAEPAPAGRAEGDAPPRVEPPAAEPSSTQPDARRPPTGGSGRQPPSRPSPSPTGRGSTTTPSEPEADPPRTSYARLEAPAAVAGGTQFALDVGLSPAPVAGVTGGRVTRPPSSTGSYDLGIQVVADGFSLAPGESWRTEVRVTAEEPYPVTTLHLTAPATMARLEGRTVLALFEIDGQTVGFASRSIIVAADASAAAEIELKPQEESSPPLGMPTATEAPDLTVRITLAGVGGPGRLLWTLSTPYPGVAVPDEPIVVDIGGESSEFARQLVEGLGFREGKPGIYDYLLGLGNTIADQLPQSFFDVLGVCAGHAAAAGRAPTVFIVSEEPHVPWELMTLLEPFDASAPPFLGAQASVGRWVLGNRRPKLPPPEQLTVEAMAVISGVYDSSHGWSRLLDAEREAEELCRVYNGVAVDAITPNVLGCLRGEPPADVWHFALHGTYDPGSTLDGLVLVDGIPLDPQQVRARPFARAPFVFLNACQVGNGAQVLGDYAGMAESFLYGGASGVVAPLWSINDALAHKLAVRFYEEAFAGESPAEVLRRERARFRDNPAGGSATAIAYVYYGHPHLRLTRE
ncbi:hypothetical protein AYO38_10350 [bacterium SCGC AG-212-C10]|nr:hypothetical protein AYO38_10350 [bacterium SCGC AG-212-C10]